MHYYSFYNSKYKFDYTYWGGMRLDTLGLQLNKPIPIADLKAQVPNLKAISIEFSKNEFKSKNFNHDQYFGELIDAFDFEEIYIDGSNRLTTLPDKLWQGKLRVLSIERLGEPLSVPIFFSETLEILAYNGDKVKFDTSAWLLPSLKELYIGKLNEDIAWVNPTLETLFIQKSSAELSIDLEKYSTLKQLYLSEVRLKKDSFRLSKTPSLESLHLSNTNCTPSEWDSIKNIKNLSISSLDIQQPLEVNFDELPLLSSLSLSINPKVNRPFLGKMPTLISLNITNEGEMLALDADLFTSQELKHISVVNVTLPPKHIAFEGASSINIYESKLENCEDFLGSFSEITLRNTSFANFDWSQLTKLRSIQIYTLVGNVLPNFNERNLALERIHIQDGTGEVEIPYSWHVCPNLKLVYFDKVKVNIPRWEKFDSLEGLYVSEKHLSPFPKEAMLWKNFAGCKETSFLRSEDKNLTLELSKITSDETLPNEAKLVLGAILFEGDDVARNIDNFKPNFLRLLSCNSSVMRDLLKHKVHLLNDTEIIIDLDSLSKKTIGILGKPKNNKTYYKEKLQAIGATYMNKVDDKTEVVVIGEKFEIPANFFNASHYFINENDLEEAVKNHEPGYIQTLETNELHNLRELIWSDEIENDRLVLELIKGGGVSDELIPDLVIVAKTSRDNSVKSSLKKLLKAKLDEGGQKILSDRSNLRNKGYNDPFEGYQKYNSNLDLSQMALTYAYRFNLSLYSFFSTPGSEQNPYRKKAFEEVYQQFLEKPHYVSINWKFNSEEFNFILSHPSIIGKLKRLAIRTEFELSEIVQSLCLHSYTLHELGLLMTGSRLPEELGELKNLRTLSISGNELEMLPASLLDLKKLKELRVFSRKRIELPLSFESLLKISGFRSPNITFV